MQFCASTVRLMGWLAQGLGWIRFWNNPLLFKKVSQNYYLCVGVPFPLCPIYHSFPSGFTGPFTFVHLMERFLFPTAYVQESEGQFMRLTLTDPSILKPKIYSTSKINPLPDHSVVFIGHSFQSACMLALTFRSSALES